MSAIEVQYQVIQLKSLTTPNDQEALKEGEIPSEMISESCDVKDFVVSAMLNGFTIQQCEAHAEFTKQQVNHFIGHYTLVAFIPNAN